MGRRHKQLHRGRWQAVRLQVLERDGWRCQSCGRAGRLEVDHIVPLHKGGAPYDLGNLASRCRTCHAGKTRLENERPRTPAEVAWRRLVADLSG